MRKLLLTVFAIALPIFLWATTASAGIQTFEAYLDGFQETPPVATPASGFSSLTLNDVTGDWTLTGSFQDLIGTANNAHIHGPAPPGTPAGVVVGLTFDFGVTSGTLSGAGTFTAPQMADLIAGLYYVNLHSTFRPGGEIRGQLTVVPEPASVALLSIGALAFAAFAWRRRRAA